jgi:hypothetical protein
MTSSETSMIKQRFFDEHLPRLKPIGEHGSTDKQELLKQPKLRSSSLLPPITHSVVSESTVANSTIESPPSSVTYTSTVHEAAHRFLLRHSLSKISPETSSTQMTNAIRQKRTSLYGHIQSKIDTGLPRTESMTRNEPDTYQLGPIRPLNWRVLKHDVEQDTQIRAHAKRIQFNSGVTYKTQLTGLGNLVRSKVKSHITSVMGPGYERYKIVVHLTVYQTAVAGLHVASRCLWNTITDNSITFKMQGVDCNILIVVFCCYTDLGAL